MNFIYEFYDLKLSQFLVNIECAVVCFRPFQGFVCELKVRKSETQ